MTHHAMNQMGHDFPVMVGADHKRIDRRVQAIVGDYMTMGHDGMGAMSEMNMPAPTNSIPMRGSKGPFGTVAMGGMFTILKVRDDVSREDGTGFYQAPPGTTAEAATSSDLTRDGVVI
jgi:manganese oxidase